VRGVDRAEFAWWVVLLLWRLAGPLSQQVFPQQYNDEEEAPGMVQGLGIVTGVLEDDLATEFFI
jgi:hypothetical protein